MEVNELDLFVMNGENMKIVIIHGQSHKGSTYHIAHMLAKNKYRRIV